MTSYYVTSQCCDQGSAHWLRDTWSENNEDCASRLTRNEARGTARTNKLGVRARTLNIPLSYIMSIHVVSSTCSHSELQHAFRSLSPSVSVFAVAYKSS